jgi:class 3 adenylate cyclase
MAVLGRVVGVGIAIAAVFALHGALTFGERTADLVPFILGGFTVANVASLPLYVRLVARLGRLRRLLDGGIPAGALPPDEVVAALRLPVHVFVAVLVQFALALSSTPLLAASWLPGLAQATVQIVVGGVAFGLVCATTQFYVLTNLVRTRIAPTLLSDGTLAHLGERQLVRVSHHLLLLATTLGIAWPSLLYILVVDADRPSSAGTTLMILVALSLFSFQMVSALRTVGFGVGHLVERMQEVKRGDLSIRAEVRGLDTLGELASSFNAMVQGLVQREQLKETFGRYVTQQVADEILAGRVALGGELRTATVLFSDIRDFTKMSEQLSPVDVVAFLNEYLGAMVDCVLEHDGVLDKFIGDAVMAVFGAPLSHGTQKDAENAVACALAMGRRLEEINARRLARGQPAIRIGIGLHTGELVAGNIGSPRRMEYTVIGDTVNTCSRLEHLTKDHGRRTLLSATTAQLVGARFPTVEVGVVPIRGRAESLVIHALTDEEDVRRTAASTSASDP